MKCGLEALSEKAPLEGLLWEENILHIDKKAFACCDGRAMRWDPVVEAGRLCSLLRRKSKVDKILENYVSIWKDAPYPKGLIKRDLDFFCKWSGRMQREEICYGYASSCKRDGGRPGTFWYLALIAAWNFGMTPHVFTLGRSKEQQLLPLSFEAKDYPLIYFLDNVNELWKPRYKEQVSTIINWCEHSEVPLWMEIREPEWKSDNAKNPLDMKGAFRAYLSKMKSRPLLDWLDEDCLSRLIRVCSKGAPENFLTS